MALLCCGGLQGSPNVGVEWVSVLLAVGCCFMNAACRGDPRALFAVCRYTCTYVLTAVSPTKRLEGGVAGLQVFDFSAAVGHHLALKSNNISCFKKFRSDFCYRRSINSGFVSGTVHPSPAPVRNQRDLRAMLNKPSVNQKLVIQGLFAFSFLCNEVF